jgi:CBS domain-containing protein
MNVDVILRSKGTAVETVPSDAAVALAAYRMASARIGCLVVSDDGVLLQGLVTERDVVRAVARHGGDAPGLRVADVMSTDPPTCRPDDDLITVMHTMTRRRYRHVPVVADGRLAGLVSIGDVVKHRLDDLELRANVLRDAYLATR